MENRMTWLILGAGAIGTYIGGSLILHGHKVAFLEQPGFAAAILDRGLRLNLHGQEHRILHPDVFSSLPATLDHAAFDVAVMAVKSYDTRKILDAIQPFRTGFPPVLCLQNGVENEAVLGEVLGEDNIIPGTLTSAISRRGPGDIILERLRGMGIASGYPLSAPIAAALSESRLNARLYSSASGMKWSKMTTNLLVNASSAILEMTPAEILANPSLYAVEIAQLREAIQVIHAQKLPLVNLPGTPIRLLAWMVSHLSPRVSRLFSSGILGRGRGQKMPSFHLDLHSGSGESEVNYLNGAVVRFGERLGVPTPVNRWLNQTLLDLTRGSIPLNEFAHQPDKYLAKISSIIGEKLRIDHPIVP